MSDMESPSMVSDKSEMSFNNENFIAMRIDTEPLMRKIEMFLNSTRTVLEQDVNGVWKERVIHFGEPLCNQEGVNGIMKIIEMIINPQNVQGNLKPEMYNEQIFYARCEITSAIIRNCVDWNIQDNKLKMLIDTILRSVELYLTRLINNLERESYKGGFQSREVIMQGEKKSGVLGGMFGGASK